MHANLSREPLFAARIWARTEDRQTNRPFRFWGGWGERARQRELGMGPRAGSQRRKATIRFEGAAALQSRAGGYFKPNLPSAKGGHGCGRRQKTNYLEAGWAGESKNEFGPKLFAAEDSFPRPRGRLKEVRTVINKRAGKRTLLLMFGHNSSRHKHVAVGVLSVE